jgi:hypothetical protein
MDGRRAAAYMSRAPSAGWQSGYAEDCKSSYSGSIPLPASTPVLYQHALVVWGRPQNGAVITLAEGS